MRTLTIDPMEIPDRVQLNSLTARKVPRRLRTERQAPNDACRVARPLPGAAGRLPPGAGGGAALAKGIG